MDYLDKDEYIIKSKSNTQQNYVLALEYIIEKSKKEIDKQLIKVIKSFFIVKFYHYVNSRIARPVLNVLATIKVFSTNSC